MWTSKGSNGGGGKQRDGKGNGSPKKPRKDGKGGAKNGGGVGGKAQPKRNIVQVWIGAKQIKCAKNKGDTNFCVGYQTGKCTKNNCPDLHRCNIVLQNGKICMNTHPANKHKKGTQA